MRHILLPTTCRHVPEGFPRVSSGEGAPLGVDLLGSCRRGRAHHLLLRWEKQSRGYTEAVPWATEHGEGSPRAGARKAGRAEGTCPSSTSSSWGPCLHLRAPTCPPTAGLDPWPLEGGPFRVGKIERTNEVLPQTLFYRIPPALWGGYVSFHMRGTQSRLWHSAPWAGTPVLPSLAGVW